MEIPYLERPYSLCEGASPLSWSSLTNSIKFCGYTRIWWHFKVINWPWFIFPAVTGDFWYYRYDNAQLWWFEIVAYGCGIFRVEMSDINKFIDVSYRAWTLKRCRLLKSTLKDETMYGTLVFNITSLKALLTQWDIEGMQSDHLGHTLTAINID